MRTTTEYYDKEEYHRAVCNYHDLLASDDEYANAYEPLVNTIYFAHRKEV